MNDQNNNVLEFKDVWKIYRMGDEKINALAGINLNIKNGSFTSIMGPSGSGNQPCSTWRDTGHAHQGHPAHERQGHQHTIWKGTGHIPQE